MHEKTLVEAKKRLLRGELVIFPTETVYGIGSNAENEDAIKLIYQVKKRPFDNPLICHFADISEIEKNFILKQKDMELAQAFWPGPLTLILEQKEDSRINNLLSNKQNLVLWGENNFSTLWISKYDIANRGIMQFAFPHDRIPSFVRRSQVCTTKPAWIQVLHSENEQNNFFNWGTDYNWSAEESKIFEAL